jgi:Histidine phosphatase superfamily (branch 1)
MLLHSRRLLLLSSAAAAALPAWGRAASGPVLLVCHALTDPGVGEPPGFVLGRCATQRNLSAEGRAQARAFGARLAALDLRPVAIRASRWCRCLHTGEEVAAGLGAAAPKTESWTVLDSFFDDRGREPAQTAALRERAGNLRGPGFELWVTHQVNISALTGAAAAMGQALWLASRADGSLAASPFE